MQPGDGLHTGVADPRVEAPEAFDGRRRDAVGDARLEQVADHDGGPLAELGRQHLRRGPVVPAVQHERGAGLAEAPGDALPDAARHPGDDDDPVGEVEQPSDAAAPTRRVHRSHPLAERRADHPPLGDDRRDEVGRA